MKAQQVQPSRPNPDTGQHTVSYSRLHTCLEAIRIAVCSCPLLHVCMCAYNQISTTIWDLEEVEGLEVVCKYFR